MESQNASELYFLFQGVTLLCGAQVFGCHGHAAFTRPHDRDHSAWPCLCSATRTWPRGECLYFQKVDGSVAMAPGSVCLYLFDFSNIRFKLMSEFMSTKTLDHPSATENRILESAGEVFAEKGFRAATIRDIVRRAKANIAAVNYHYGDKQGLYTAVFRYARKCCEEQFPVTGDAGATPRENLHAFIRSLLLRILDHGRPAWHWQLMAREMMEPTAALDEMVEQSIKREFAIIAGIVSDMTQLDPQEPRVRLCASSIIGQVLFYRHAQAVVHRLHPEQEFARKDLEELAAHITDFSACALEAMAGQLKTRSTPKRLNPSRERQT